MAAYVHTASYGQPARPSPPRNSPPIKQGKTFSRRGRTAKKRSSSLGEAEAREEEAGLHPVGGAARVGQ